MTSNSTSEREQRLNNHMARLGAGLLLLKEKMEAPIRRPLSYPDRVTFDFEGEQYAIVPVSLLDSEAASAADVQTIIDNLNDFTAFGIWWSDLDHSFRDRFQRLLQAALNSNATSMRDLCVKTVRAMGAVWKGIGDQSSGYDEKYFYGKADAAGDIETELESLTLGQEQK